MEPCQYKTEVLYWLRTVKQNIFVPVTPGDSFVVIKVKWKIKVVCCHCYIIWCCSNWFWKKKLISSRSSSSIRYCCRTNIEISIASNKSWMMPSPSRYGVQQLWGRSKIWEREKQPEQSSSTNHTSGAPFPPKFCFISPTGGENRAPFLPANLANILLPPGEIVCCIGFQDRQ